MICRIRNDKVVKQHLDDHVGAELETSPVFSSDGQNLLISAALTFLARPAEGKAQRCDRVALPTVELNGSMFMYVIPEVGTVFVQSKIHTVRDVTQGLKANLVYEAGNHFISRESRGMLISTILVCNL